MRKILSLFLLTVLLIGSISAQVTVQGQPHPTAQKPAQSKAKPQLKADANFTFDDIQFWVGSGSKKAALVIEWHDGKSPDALVWGYRWDGEANGHDMIMAIAQADPRLVLLTQLTGSMGYTINGIGYNCPSGSISYNLEAARTDPKMSFKFEPPYTMGNQTGDPQDPEGDIASALKSGEETGVIYHPFNSSLYGYPAYDYDHWTCSGGLHWDAGWYNGYWSYWVGSSPRDLSYSGLGATSRQLTDGSWDGWSYQRYMGEGGSQGGESLGNRFLAAPKPGDPLPSLPDDPGDSDNPDNPDNPGDSGDPSTPSKPETITPEVTVAATEVVFSFPEIAQTSYYVVRLYKKENNKEALFLTAQTTSDGTVVAITRAGSNQVTIRLNRLDKGFEYRAEIEAIKKATSGEGNILGKANVSFKTKGDGSTAIETPSANTAKVYYASGNLHLLNLEGYTCTLITISGQTVHSFRLSSSDVFRPVSLANGIYLLVAQKQGERKVFKFVITKTKL